MATSAGTPTEMLFDAEVGRVLDVDGRPSGTLAVPADLSDEDLLSLHRQLVLTRRLDTELVALQRQGQLSTYPPCIGQEAAQVGTAAALGAGDWVFPSFRELGCAVVRGVPVVALAHAWRGTWFSDYDPRQHRFGPLSVPVGTNALHAVGLAMGAKLAGDPLVAAAYFGDGATSEGDVHEAMNFAAVFAAPVVFVVQNNGWAISTPTARQYAVDTLARRAGAYGMPGWTCDGNDVLACYAVMRRAVTLARDGGGPSLVEAITYRMGPHTTADDPTRYRSAEELAAWSAADPILRYERFLAGRGLLGDEVMKASAAGADAAAAALRAAIVDAAAPDPLEVFDHVYVDPPAALGAQRALMAAELEAWADTAAGASTAGTSAGS